MGAATQHCAPVSAGLSTSNAALLGQEEFDIGGGQYSVGALSGQNPANSFFTGAWFDAGATDVQVVSGGLTWPGLQTSGGATATGTIPAASETGRVGRNLATPWDNTTVGTYYISFLASFGNTDGSPTHHRVVEAWNGALSNDGNRVLQLGYSEFTGLGTTLSVNVLNNQSTFDNNTQIATDNGATHLFVLRFDLSNQALGDVMYGYEDPADLSTEPGSPNALLFGFDFGLTTFGTMVQFVFNGNPPGSTGYFDELRFGTTYQDVLPVPEPTTFGLFGLGTLGLIMARRRNRA